MSVSRFDKFLRERAKTASIAEAQGFRKRPIELAIGAGVSVHLVRPAVALALRCFTGDVHLVADDGAAGALLTVAADEGRAYGEASRLHLGPAPDTAAVVQLGLGKAIDGVFVDAAGAVASVNRLARSKADAWPPAAAFAVACGFGKLFTKIIGAARDVCEEQWNFSLLELTTAEPGNDPAVPAKLDVGKIVLIGGGAIGSAFAFVLKMTGWRCELQIVDPEAYEEPNHETTLLISKKDALSCLPKAKTLAAVTANDAVAAEPIDARVDANHAVLEAPCHVLICAVDNPHTRRILDDAACDVLLNGALGGSGLDTGLVLWTRHADGDPTLASVYPELPETKSSTPLPTDVDECSRFAYEGVALAAPFMALAAASLLAAGCAHRALGTSTASHYLQFDLLELQSKYSERGRTSEG